MKTPAEWTHWRDFIGGEYDTVERMQALIAEVQQDAQRELRNALQAMHDAALEYDDILHSDAMKLAQYALQNPPPPTPETSPLTTARE